MSEAAVFIYLVPTIALWIVFSGFISLALWGKPKWPWFTPLLLMTWMAGHFLFAHLALNPEIEINSWGALLPSLIWFGIGFLFFEHKGKTLP